MMRWNVALSLASVLIPAVNAIFADDAFHIDYHQALLGTPQTHATFFHRPQASSNASLLYTVSDKGVLGAVNPKDGSLLWRQALAGEPGSNASKAYLIAGEGDGKITSGYENMVSCWDALSGKLVWTYDVQGGLSIRGLQAVPVLGSIADGAVQDVVVLAGPGVSGTISTVTRVAGDGNGVRWQHTDTSVGEDTSLSIATSEKHVYYITKSSGLLSGGKAKVEVLDSATGKEVNHYSIAVDSIPLGGGSEYVAASCSRSPFLVSSEKPFKSIKFNLLGASKASTLQLEDKGEEIEGLSIHHPCNPAAPRHFLVHAWTKTRHWAEVYHIDAKSGDVAKAYTLPATAENSVFAASSTDLSVYFARITDSEIVVYSSESHAQLGRWARQDFRPARDSKERTLSAAAEVAVRSNSGPAIRVSLNSANGDWTLLRNGDVQWTRPEGLAYATVAVWSDDVEPVALAADLEIETSSNPLTAYTHRLKRHLHDLAYLPQYLMKLPEALLYHSDEKGTSTAEKLMGSKLAIVATSRHVMVALDATKAGSIKWRIDLSDLVAGKGEVRSLLADEGRITAYLSDGSLIVVGISDGKVIEHKSGSIPLSKIVELPGHPASTIVKIDDNGIPRVATDFAPALPDEGNVLVTINEKGEAAGWTIGRSVETTWTLQPREGARFVNAIGRPNHDPVASIGKVLGDRSVLYKYLSPNLALLTAVSSTTLSIFLVEAVTGTLLHSATHEGVLINSFTPSLISENWFVYSFTGQNPSTSGISTQLIISELYESSVPNDRGPLSSQTNFSSFSPDAVAKPYVISRAFTVAEPISNFAVSQTSQGITTRQLLAVLPNSNAIVGIPRDVLNARRPVDRDPTPLEAEEGLFRYTPILDLDPKFFLTHSREVIGIEKLMSSPTLLESTSLVFGYGHDIFGSQLAPSNTFDVLGKGFKRVQLILTVVALFVGVVFLRPLVRKKLVQRRWT